MHYMSKNLLDIDIHILNNYFKAKKKIKNTETISQFNVYGLSNYGGNFCWSKAPWSVNDSSNMAN